LPYLIFEEDPETRVVIAPRLRAFALRMKEVI
jgi:hypothetical protein